MISDQTDILSFGSFSGILTLGLKQLIGIKFMLLMFIIVEQIKLEETDCVSDR